MNVSFLFQVENYIFHKISRIQIILWNWIFFYYVHFIANLNRIYPWKHFTKLLINGFSQNFSHTSIQRYWFLTRRKYIDPYKTHTHYIKWKTYSPFLKFLTKKLYYINSRRNFRFSPGDFINMYNYAQPSIFKHFTDRQSRPITDWEKNFKQHKIFHKRKKITV